MKMRKNKMKTFMGLLCAVTMGASVVMMSGCLDGSGNSSSSGNQEDSVQATSYVSLDINPSIELTLDAENKVISVYGGNEDGQVLLYEETGIIGEDVQIAVDKIVDLAVELGYLDEENKVISTNVVSNTQATVTELLSKIDATFTATSNELGYSLTTDTEGAFSLLRQMEQLKEAYPNNTAIQNVSVSKFKLALSAAETGEVALDVAVAMDTPELLNLVKETHMQMESFATEAFKEAKAKASETYKKKLGMDEARVYMQYATEKGKILVLPYGAAYFMYKASACGFEAIADTMFYAEKLSNYELSQTQVSSILQVLGLEDNAENKGLLADSNGKITVKSVEAYADKMFKNTPAGQQLEEVKANLSDVLNSAETTFKTEVDKVKATYAPQIRAIIVGAEAGVTAIETIQPILPETIQQAVSDFKGVALNVHKAIEGRTFSQATLRQLAKEMNQKAENLMNTLKTFLSKEDVTAIETKLAKIENEYASQKAEMQSKLSQAEQDAKDKLASLKASRKN